MNNNPNEPKLLEHEADGIKELDNLLPRWWVWLFYLCTIFAVVYLVHFHVVSLADFIPQPRGPLIVRLPLAIAHDLLDGPRTSRGEYEQESAAGEKLKALAIAKFEASVDTLTPSKDTAVIAQGKTIFGTYCAPCHRPDAGGLVGPNLCDDYWIHGSNYVDNVKIIINGVPAKGMLTWRGVLKPDQIQSVASYVYTLRGTNPKNPKPPENTVQAPTGPSAFE